MVIVNRAMSSPLKWHGGKNHIAGWLRRLSPTGYTHRLIPYAGGLGELWGWDCEGISETVNDSNQLLVNFYRVLREQPEAFIQTVNLVPFSEAEFNKSWRSLDAANRWWPRDLPLSVSLAVDFYVVNRMGRQGLMREYATPTKRVRRGMNENVSAWLSAVDGLSDCIDRLQRVEVRCMDALLFIRKYDHANAFFYCDPPYLHATRASTGEYGAHEMTIEQHSLLLQVLATIKGKFLLSGYASNLYSEWATRHGYRSEVILVNNRAGSGLEQEVVWMNY